MQDHYDVLGVPETASPQEIKQAYRRMAMRWHPDRNLDEKVHAEARFKCIAEAWATLSDPQKRQRYDASRVPEDPPDDDKDEDEYEDDGDERSGQDASATDWTSSEEAWWTRYSREDLSARTARVSQLLKREEDLDVILKWLVSIGHDEKEAITIVGLAIQLNMEAARESIYGGQRQTGGERVHRAEKASRKESLFKSAAIWIFQESKDLIWSAAHSLFMLVMLFVARVLGYVVGAVLLVIALGFLLTGLYFMLLVLGFILS